jgi:hypothetical protein
MKTSSQLLPILRSQLQGELLTLLYLHPDQEYSLSEAARLLDSSPRMIHYELDRLIKSGLVAERRVGNVRLLHAESASPIFRPLSEILAVTYGPLPVLTELLATIDGVTSAYIYGSWAARYAGEPGPAPADVDVLVVGTARRAELDSCAQAAEARLRRPVNIRRVSQSAWEESPLTSTFLISVKSRPLVSLKPEVSGDRLVTVG